MRFEFGPEGSGPVRQVLYIAIAAGVLAGCASGTAGYPNLSDMKERPTIALTPERTEELLVILNREREVAQAFATLGFREEQTLANAIASADAAAAIPDPSLHEAVVRPQRIETPPPAIPFEALQEEAAPPARQPQVLVSQDQVSPEALANSATPEELLAAEKDFK